MDQCLIQLLDLQHRARDAATLEELTFLAVNEPHAVAPYRQSALWVGGRGIIAVSGLSAIERNAPFTLWLESFCRRKAGEGQEAPSAITPELLSESDRVCWLEWLPACGLWLPFASGRTCGALMLAREQPWDEGEIRLLAEAAHAVGHALGVHCRPSAWSGWWRKVRGRGVLALGAAAGLCLAALYPVPLSVLGPGEVVAVAPVVIRAPIDGVVGLVRVAPNQRVGAGEVLFELDDTVLRGRYEVAEKASAAAEAEFRQYSQQALFDPTARPKLAAARGVHEQKTAELTSIREMLERLRVKAPAAGIAVIDDPSEWVGRPVVVGEKVLAVADEEATEIEAWLAPGDAIELPPGSDVSLFLNAAPLSPVKGGVRYVAYEATPRPDGTVAHRVRASLREGQTPPRLGLRGTARLSGRNVPLIYWLLRRPWGIVRANLGF